MLLGAALEATISSSLRDIGSVSLPMLLSTIMSTAKRSGIQLLEVPLEAAGMYPSLFNKETLTAAVSAAHDHGLAFSVHLPYSNLDLSSKDSLERHRSIDHIKEAIELGSNLDPFSYVLHLLPEQSGNTENDFRSFSEISLADDVIDRTTDSLRQIITVLDPTKLCVENLRGNPFPPQAGIALAAGASLCLDVGHALVQGLGPVSMLSRYADSVREVHLHDVRRIGSPGLGYVREDHHELGSGILDLAEFIGELKKHSFDGLLNVEVFVQERLAPSLEALRPSL